MFISFEGNVNRDVLVRFITKLMNFLQERHDNKKTSVVGFVLKQDFITRNSSHTHPKLIQLLTLCDYYHYEERVMNFILENDNKYVLIASHYYLCENNSYSRKRIYCRPDFVFYLKQANTMNEQITLNNIRQLERVVNTPTTDKYMETTKGMKIPIVKNKLIVIDLNEDEKLWVESDNIIQQIALSVIDEDEVVEQIIV